MQVRLDGWIVEDDLFGGAVTVELDGTERPWIEGSETSPRVVVGVDVEEPYSDDRVRLVFPTIEACRDWLRIVANALTLEAWVQEAPHR